MDHCHCIDTKLLDPMYCCSLIIGNYFSRFLTKFLQLYVFALGMYLTRNLFSIFLVGKEIVDVAAQMADQWAKEDKKETSRNKSDESLGNLINGKYLYIVTKVAAHLTSSKKL